MKSSRFNEEIDTMLSVINKSTSLSIFVHNEGSNTIEVQTAINSPYLLFEIEIQSRNGEVISGEILYVWLSQPVSELFQCDLQSWCSGLEVILNLKSVKNKNGIMTKMID